MEIQKDTTEKEMARKWFFGIITLVTFLPLGMLFFVGGMLGWAPPIVNLLYFSLLCIALVLLWHGLYKCFVKNDTRWLFLPHLFMLFSLGILALF